MIEIRPVEFSWYSEWLPRIRHDRQAVLAAMKVSLTPALTAAQVISEQNQATDRWLKLLSANKQEDVVSLTKAECELLWMIIDPPHPIPKPGEYECSDFRERWFDAIPLALAIFRAFDNESVLQMYRRLEQAAEEKGWLP